MTVSIPADDHDDSPRVYPGGWLSAAATNPRSTDNRPEFSVGFFVHEALRILREHGIRVDAAPGQLHVATLAAGDLLGALGVKPAAAPDRKA